MEHLLGIRLDKGFSGDSEVKNKPHMCSASLVGEAQPCKWITEMKATDPAGKARAYRVPEEGRQEFAWNPSGKLHREGTV